MVASTEIPDTTHVVRDRSTAASDPRSHSPAGAASRITAAGAFLGAVGIASALLVVLRVLQTWRIEPSDHAHRVSILGAHVSYPTANVAAIVILCQALLGIAVLAGGGRAAFRELRATRRFTAWVRSRVAYTLEDAAVVQDDRAEAFCARLLRPRIYVSTAAVAVLDTQALAAVLDHEREHRRRDPLRLTIGRILASALFFVPGLGALTRHYQSLAELRADEHAVRGSSAARQALARAMLAFDEHSGRPEGTGIDPARADALLGEPPHWRFPLAVCLAATAVLAVLIAIGVLVGRVATGAATLDVPFLSAQPCVLMLALIPGLLATSRVVRLRSAG